MGILGGRGVKQYTSTTPKHQHSNTVRPPLIIQYILHGGFPLEDEIFSNQSLQYSLQRSAPKTKLPDTMVATLCVSSLKYLTNVRNLIHGGFPLEDENQSLQYSRNLICSHTKFISATPRYQHGNASGPPLDYSIQYLKSSTWWLPIGGLANFQ